MLVVGVGMNQLLSGSLGSAANGLGGGDPGKTNAWRVAGSQLAGLAGAAAVDGDVNDGAWIAKQADAYNRQLHKDELKLIADNYKEYAEEQRALGRDITDGQALKELLYQAHAQVDAAYANDEDQKTWAFLSNVDEQAAGDFLGQISEGTAVTHDDGVTTTAFQATDDQKNNSFINYTHLLDTESGSYGELLFGYRRPILTNMSMDIGAGNYQEVLSFANRNAADQQREVNLIIPKAIAGGPVLRILETGSKLFMLGGAASAAAGYYNDGANGALTATSGYMQMVGGSTYCASSPVSCWATAPVAFDGANNVYKGVWANASMNDSRSSLYAWGSDEMFGTPKPGMVIDYTTDFMSLMNAPRHLANPDNLDSFSDSIFMINSSAGVWGQLNNGGLSISSEVDND